MTDQEKALVNRLGNALASFRDYSMLELANYLKAKTTPEFIDLCNAMRKYRDFVRAQAAKDAQTDFINRGGQ